MNSSHGSDLHQRQSYFLIHKELSHISESLKEKEGFQNESRMIDQKTQSFQSILYAQNAKQIQEVKLSIFQTIEKASQKVLSLLQLFSEKQKMQKEKENSLSGFSSFTFQSKRKQEYNLDQNILKIKAQPLQIYNVHESYISSPSTVRFICEEKYKIDQGLPNAGNTCFLNSAIQMLFSAQKFREKIYFYESFHSDESLLSILSKIFKSIENGKDTWQKRTLLQKFIDSLQCFHDNYKSFSQQDSFDFLNLIFQILGQLHPQLLTFFKIEYQSQCKCEYNKKGKNSEISQINYQKLKYQDFSLPLGQQQCIQCDSEVKITILQAPQYLVCMGIKKYQGMDEIFYKKSDGTACKYLICSKIIYSGSGSFGHYISYRKNMEGKFVYISDSTMKEVLYPYDFGHVTVYLYELDETAKNLKDQDLKLNYIQIYDPFEVKYIKKLPQHSNLLQVKKDIDVNQIIKRIQTSNLNLQRNRLLYQSFYLLKYDNLNKCQVLVFNRKEEEDTITTVKRSIFFTLEVSKNIYNYLQPVVFVTIQNAVNFFFLKTNKIEFKRKDLDWKNQFIDLLLCLERKLLKLALDHQLFKQNLHDFYRQNFKSSKIHWETVQSKPILQLEYR